MRLVLIFLLAIFCNAKSIEIQDFESDLYSKNGGLKKVQLSVKIIGDNVDKELDYITDSLNMIISSYFYEDLFTESGKEKFKQTLIKYLGKKYSVNIDQVLFIKLKSKDSAEAIKEILKDANLI